MTTRTNGVSKVTVNSYLVEWSHHAQPRRNEEPMGRRQHPSGDRALIAGRIPVDYDQKLKRYTQLTGKTRTDLVAELVCDFLDKVDLDVSDGQEELPLQRTA